MNKRTVLQSLLLIVALSANSVFAQDFPATTEHKFGSTTLQERPERIVSLGYTEQDALLALGAEPAAVRYFFGDEEDAIFPWAEDEAEGIEPEVLNMPFGELNYERILALQPDLITAVDSGITQEEYDTLSQIAPTLAQSDDYIDFGAPWQERVRRVALALGETERAERLVGELEAEFAQARQAHPEFAGKTVAVAYESGGTYGFYTAQDARARFFEDLGFVVPETLVDIAGESFYANLSEERLDLLDQDLLVLLDVQFTEGDAQRSVAEDPLLSQLSAVQEGRVLSVTGDAIDALQFGTVLSLGYLLENLVPEVAEAVGAE